MNAKIENALDMLEVSCDSAAIAVADHLRTVAENGAEYATPAAMREQAESLRDWAQTFLDQTQTMSWESEAA